MSKIHLILMPEYLDSNGLPPLGIACLGAYLKNNGVDVTGTDFRLTSRSTDSLFKSYYDYGKTAYVSEIPDLPLILCLVKNYKKGKPLLYGFQDIILNYIQHKSLNYFSVKNNVEEIYSIMTQQIEKLIQHEIIGFTTIYSNLFFTIMLSLLLRQEKPNIKIIYGGPQTTLSINSAKLILKLRIADIVILGEGEDTLLKVIRSYEIGKLPVLEGTITYDSKKDFFLIKPPNSFLNLDTLPDPNFSIFQLPRYSPLSLPLYASKGCIFKCHFCCYNKFSSFRFKDHIKVVDSMEHLHRKFNTIRFIFSDSALNIHPEWLEQFAEELIKRKCNLQWGGFFKPWMTEKLLSKLKQSGLYRVTIGAESFSNRLLKKMGKGNTNTNDIIKTIELFCSANIQVTTGLIVGFPGELKSDFFYTWKQVLKLNEKYPKNFFISPQIFQLRPLSECYEKYYNYGLIVKKWNQKIIHTIPEVNDIVKNIPMVFFGQKPKNREALHRFEMISNISQPYNIYMSETEKGFLKECLKHIKKSSTVSIVISLKISSYSKVIGKSKTTFFIINYPPNKLLLSDEEMFILKCLNEHNSLSDIATMLSLQYHEDKKRSYKLILQFLNYLINNNIPLKIQYYLKKV